jgi:hypothetical protein
MQMRPITANPSQMMVEQLAASGVKYVFYNSRSREAHFFDSSICASQHPWHSGPTRGQCHCHGWGYTQARLDPEVARCVVRCWSCSGPV